MKKNPRFHPVADPRNQAANGGTGWVLNSVRRPAIAAAMRKFPTGGIRSADAEKLDFEGFLSPTVLVRFAAYMRKHQIQQDGELRTSDNWQKGMPLDAYMKSMHRHFMDAWLLHRGLRPVASEDIEDALCAVLFNVQGYLFEILRNRGMLQPK